MLNFTKKKKIKQYLSKYLFLLTALLFLLFPFSPVRAVWDILNPIWYASKLAYGIVYVIGLFFVLILSFLQKVATWNHFIDVPTVIQGWVIVRDLSNMFFILVLLVIAFATILRVENYSARRLLPKLLLMALLINFSRTICGLIIDASQVVMLTFVAGFSGTGVNNFVDLLGLDNMVKIVSDSGSDPTKSVDLGTFSLFSGVIAAVFAALAATIVLIVLLAVLIFRVVMLWLYVILSPLAFLLSTFPAGARYASMWWQEFIKQVIIGPVLAFFLWLALATASNSSRQLTALGDANGFVSNIPTELFQASNFQLYLITLGLLIGGLITAQQLGGAAGRIAGRGQTWFNRAARTSGRIASRATTLPVRRGARYTGGRIGSALLERARTRQEQGLSPGIGGVVGGWMYDRAQRSYDQQARRTYRRLTQLGMGENAIQNLRTMLHRPDESRRVRWVEPRTLQENAGRDILRGGFYNALFGNLYRATHSRFAQESRTRASLAAALRELGIEPNQPNQGGGGGGNQPLEFNKERYEATKAWRAKGSPKEEFDENKHYSDKMFKFAQVVYEPENYIKEEVEKIKDSDPNKEKQRRQEREKMIRENLAKEREISLSAFAKGKSNEIALDMSKLGIEELRSKGKEWKEVIGRYIADPNLIKKVSKQIIKAIDKELATATGERKIELENAKKRLSKPEELKDLLLFNNQNPAWRTSTRAGKYTVTHERLHRTTLDEQKVEKETEEIVKTRKYSKVPKVASKVEEIIEKEKQTRDTEDHIREVRHIYENYKIPWNENLEEIMLSFKKLNRRLKELANSGNKTAESIINLANRITPNSTSLEIKVIKDKIEEKLKKI